MAYVRKGAFTVDVEVMDQKTHAGRKLRGNSGKPRLHPRFFAVIWLAGLIVLGTGDVSGQDYPYKPVRIFTSLAGGGTDFAARIIAQGLAAALGQPVIVENRPLLVSIETVSKAAPDGYTVLVSGDTLWIVPLLQSVSYDTVRDFSPVTFSGRSPLVLIVHPSLPVNSAKDLITLAKAKPGMLNYGAPATGSTSHLGTEYFKALTGVDIVRISYKGNGPALTAALSNEVQLIFITPPPAGPHIKTGRIRALAVTGLQQYEPLPELPTLSAAGLPGFEVLSIDSVVAPAKTPVSIIDRLQQAIVRDLHRPDVKRKFFDAGIEVVGTSQEESAHAIKSEIAKWSKVIKDAGIKVD